MERERIIDVFGGKVRTQSGVSSLMGNFIPQIGDYVYVDSGYVFGHQNVFAKSPIVIASNLVKDINVFVEAYADIDLDEGIRSIYFRYVTYSYDEKNREIKQNIIKDNIQIDFGKNSYFLQNHVNFAIGHDKIICITMDYLTDKSGKTFSYGHIENGKYSEDRKIVFLQDVSDIKNSISILCISGEFDNEDNYHWCIHLKYATEHTVTAHAFYFMKNDKIERVVTKQILESEISEYYLSLKNMFNDFNNNKGLVKNELRDLSYYNANDFSSRKNFIGCINATTTTNYDSFSIKWDDRLKKHGKCERLVASDIENTAYYNDKNYINGSANDASIESEEILLKKFEDDIIYNKSNNSIDVKDYANIYTEQFMAQVKISHLSYVGIERMKQGVININDIDARGCLNSDQYAKYDDDNNTDYASDVGLPAISGNPHIVNPTDVWMRPTFNNNGMRPDLESAIYVEKIESESLKVIAKKQSISFYNDVLAYSSNPLIFEYNDRLKKVVLAVPEILGTSQIENGELTNESKIYNPIKEVYIINFSCLECDKNHTVNFILSETASSLVIKGTLLNATIQVNDYSDYDFLFKMFSYNNLREIKQCEFDENLIEVSSHYVTWTSEFYAVIYFDKRNPNKIIKNPFFNGEQSGVMVVSAKNKVEISKAKAILGI